MWRPDAARRGEWQPLDMNNADFEEYYKTQQIVPEGKGFVCSEMQHFS